MQFTIGQIVTIETTEKDEGGEGIVTRIRSDTGAEGSRTQLCVDIKGHAKQDAAREKKGKKHRGFWYNGKLTS